MALTKIVASRSGHRTTLIPFSGIVDDGSTLSLDFTTGVLDPRLTFTRSTNATFINSSGLVEWANANMYWNTAFEGLSGTNPTLGAGPPATGWIYAGFAGNIGSAVFNGDGTVTITTSGSERRAIMRSSGFSGNGLRVIASVEVTIHSGSLQASQVMVTGTPTNAQHYVNGTAWNASHPSWNGGILPVGTQFTFSYATDCITGGTTNIYFGVGCSSQIAGSATFSNPRWTMWKGSGTVPYYPNTSATNNSTANYFKSNDYQAPRFDYDPTSIGTPRGLLIEGSATNLINWSETFDTTGGATNWNWSSLNVTRGTVTTTNPTGASATVIKIEETTANGIHAPLIVPTVLASTTYTFSVWAKAVERTFVQLLENGGSGANSMVNLSTGAIVSESTAGITNVTAFGTTGWYRISMRLTTIAGQTTANCQLRLSTNGSTTSYAGTTGSGIYIWGAQLETGSGASSYIPTGASTGSRAADSCDCTSGNFSSWYTQGPGTLLVHARPFRQNYSDLASLCTSATDPRFAIRTNDPPSAAQITLYGNNGGTLVNKKTSNSYSINNLLKTAVGLQQGNYAVVLNGGTVATDSGSGTFPTALNRLTIGHTASGGEANAWISLIKYWPTRLPDSQLQSLTT